MWYRVANKFVYKYIITDSIDGILYDCDDDHVICCALLYTQHGRAVLHCAAVGGNPSVVDRFINAGLDLNAVNKVSHLIVL